MKTLLIIIPGSKTKQSKLLDPLLEKFYAHFWVETGNDDWADELAEHLRDSEIDTEVFTWSGGISETLSLHPAAEKLKDFIRKRGSDYEKVILFGKSLWGVVAEIATQDISLNVCKLIYVATPHRKLRSPIPSNVSIINIYSSEDTYVSLANNLLYFGFGRKELSNAENIDIANVRHSEFNANCHIVYKEKEVRLFDLYKTVCLKNYPYEKY